MWLFDIKCNRKEILEAMLIRTEEIEMSKLTDRKQHIQSSKIWINRVVLPNNAEVADNLKR